MFTKFEEDVSVHQSLADEPNIDNGLSADGLKKLWDKPAEQLKEAFNNFIDEVTKETAASQIGATALEQSDTSEGNVQAKLLYLLSVIQGVSQGQIPDGTITKAKLDNSYSGILAEKNTFIQEGLNAEMVGGENLEQILAHKTFVTGVYNGSSAGIQITLDFKPNTVIVFNTLQGSGVTISSISLAIEGFSSGISIRDDGFSASSSSAAASTGTHAYIAFK